ncbi:hypothetical protein [Massilia sp. IC2-476]|nr:hypothetical protein [Massilia sp. IC2-476]
MWESQITALAEAGYRAIAYDRPSCSRPTTTRKVSTSPCSTA